MPEPSRPTDFQDVTPYVPASTSLPEITVKAIVLGVVLSMLLSAANAYLGLLAGMTVSASIPAAVISMAALKLFPRSNVLENNIVQTSASAGESLLAGVIFTIPALVMLGAWTDFDYLQTTVIAGLGGLLGVLFTIPLRRALVLDSPLTFPEGVATAEVLKVGDQGGGVKSLALGAGIGALFKLGATGLGLWTGAAHVATRLKSSAAFLGSELSPALVGVGYIVGLNIAVLVFLGGALNFFVAIPAISAGMEWPQYGVEVDGAPEWATFAVPADAPERAGTPVPADEWAMTLWSNKTRYLGVGAMLVGGVWALLRLWRSLVRGIASGIAAYRAGRGAGGGPALARTERDTPMPWVAGLALLSVVPLFLVFMWILTHPVEGSDEAGLAVGQATGIAAFMAVIMLVAGFLFSAVASYMAGLVGSSNNPISGVTIATVLTASLLLLVFLGTGSAMGPVAALAIGGVVCCAAAIGGDNMQDLKAGQIVGATPWKQQVMQVIGVVSAALVIPLVLNLLHTAYGIGMPRPGGEPGDDFLAAPQASLMQAVAEGVFAQSLDWPMIGIGMGIAAVVIACDLVLEARRSGFRMPVLAVAVGVYLPLELSVPIFIGGLLSAIAHHFHMRRIHEADGELKSSLQEAKATSARNGLLLAAGLITGEALVGILLAIPIAVNEGVNPLALSGREGAPLAEALTWPGLVLLGVVAAVLLRVAMHAPGTSRPPTR